MIKTSEHGYISITSWPHYGEKAIPLYKTEGDKAWFFLISGPSVERKVWLRREDIS